MFIVTIILDTHDGLEAVIGVKGVWRRARRTVFGYAVLGILA